MVSVQDWKRAVLSQTGDIDHTCAAEALAELLEGSSSPLDTAKKITTIYEPPSATRKERGQDGENEKVTEFWITHMCDAISTFGELDKQDRLIDLLVDMSRQDDVRSCDDVLKGGGGSIYWRGLPEWEWQFSHYGLGELQESSTQLCANIQSQPTDTLKIIPPTGPEETAILARDDVF